MDLGHVGENLYLAAEALQLEPAALEHFHKKVCDRMLLVGGEEEFTVYAQPVGRVQTEVDEESIFTALWKKRGCNTLTLNCERRGEWIKNRETVREQYEQRKPIWHRLLKSGDRMWIAKSQDAKLYNNPYFNLNSGLGQTRKCKLLITLIRTLLNGAC